jgi:SRSO17 transposase
MTNAQLAKCRKRLEQCLADLVAPLGRSERRHWADVYVRGLVLDGARKSIEPLATRVPDGNVQALQHLVSQSPWDWLPVQERLAQRMTAELAPDPVWVIEDTGFPKQGTHSVGVERQHSGTLGKVGNCHVAVSLHQVSDEGHAILGWRLYLPEGWAMDRARRPAAGIPDDVGFKPKWQLGLDLIDQARAWGLPERLVVAVAGYGDATEFREGLAARRLAYVVRISAPVGVWTRPPQAAVPPDGGRGQPPTRYAYGQQRPISAKEAATTATGWKTVRWWPGPQGWLTSRCLARRVQPSHGFVDGQPPHPEVWLLVEWPATEKEPTQYWLCDLPPTTPLRRLVRLAKCRWPIEQDCLQLKDELGLAHYEGRGWVGWHHHVTLVMLAHAFLTLMTLRRKKHCWVDPAADAS